MLSAARHRRCHGVSLFGLNGRLTTACLSMPSFIDTEPAFHGVICPSAMATGKRRTSACGDGAKVAFLRAFSRLWRLMPMPSTCRSIQPASAPTNIAQALKKRRRRSSHRQIPRRADDQDPRHCRCARQPRGAVAHARPAADITQAAALLDQVEPEAFLADEGYDSDALIRPSRSVASRPLSPRKPIVARRAEPISPSTVSAISSSASSTSSSGSAPSPPATISSPTLSLPPSPWFAYSSGSTDDRA